MKFTSPKAGCLFASLLLIWLGVYAPTVSAGVMLNGTRIILNADERNTSTIVSNITSNDYAVQVWLNDSTDSDKILAPFIAMPALFRVRAGEEQVVRVIKTPGQLPVDRESVFYFNAQEIPIASKQDVNALKVAIRTRIKLFYRPAALKMKVTQAPASLQWQLTKSASGSVLRVTNPSPYHVTFVGVRVLGAGKNVEVSDVDMIEPFSTHTYPIGQALGTLQADVEFSVINDYGGNSDIYRIKTSS